MCFLHFCWFVFKVKSKALVKLEKCFFISLKKLISFSRKSNFRILNFQISWCHQMPKHKTRNGFYWISLEVSKTVSSRSSTKTAARKLPPGLSLQKIKHNLYSKMKFLKQSTYIRYVMWKLNQHAGHHRFLFTEDFWKVTYVRLSLSNNMIMA